MNDVVASRLRADIQVSEPWEFVTACGAHKMSGTVEKLEHGEVWIALDVPVDFNGSRLGHVVARARYTGEIVTDARRAISVNAVFCANPRHTGDGVAAIGVLTIL